MAEYDNPWTELRLLVGSALTEYAALVTAIGGANNIQLYDRAIDIRGDLKKSNAGQNRAVLWPADNELELDWAGHAARFRRVYAVEILSRGKQPKPIEYFEWLIIKGVARLYMGKKADGSGDNWTAPAPLVIQAITITRADPDRDQVNSDTDQWTSVCDIVATGSVAIADLIAA
jgi:hypothetical protein